MKTSEFHPPQADRCGLGGERGKESASPRGVTVSKTNARGAEPLWKYPRRGYLKEVFGDDLEREVEVHGQCMRFLIEDGETTVVRWTKPKMLTIGDIVVFQKDEQFVIHRIIYKRQKNGRYVFTTKGDLHPSFDSPVGEEQIFGKVVTIKKPIGLISLATSAGKLLSYSIFIYSVLSYLTIVTFSQTINCLLSLFFRIVHLLHQINNRFIGMIPLIPSHLNRGLNQISGLICRIGYSGGRWNEYLLRFLRVIPAVFFTIFTCCSHFFSDKKRK